ncbi:lipid kinase [Faunimonas sp. B44]|uniref:lipid kinase n=1 Tax=Faunimonas sp. B44 TaxID=3461493 RepID=UPI004043CB5C
MRVLVAVNQGSRNGREPLDAALAVFARAGWAVALEQVAKSRQVDGLVRAHDGKVDLVVLAGGDGTIHHAARALIETALPFGLLPTGSANDLARNLGIPLALGPAAEVVVDGGRRGIDVAEVNGELYLNVAHLGIGAALDSSGSKALKRRFGRFGYLMAALGSVARMAPFDAEVTIDGEATSVRAVQITVGNGRFFGGMGTVSEAARIDDGLLHVFSVEQSSRLRLLLMVPSFLTGHQDRWNGVEVRSGRAVTIATGRPMPVRADGKTVAQTPARFAIHPGALQVCAPRAPGR